MACANFAMDVIEGSSGRREGEGDEGLLIKHYRVSELIPSPKLPLHRLLKREPAVWAAVQVSSGVLSVGIGVMFAASFGIADLLLTLFRVPIVSGVLMCFQANIFCLVMATIGAVLLCVDLGGKKPHVKSNDERTHYGYYQNNMQSDERGSELYHQV
ncbi:hypothetical protein C0J50_0550 [Silurus asotus]|uniref:Uncharacterized protein n=1 Tax=Silurus asotus TaxID=30991 RepID=A0AAD5A973_SILAS|nr:hypothetical protein C0J50_0550 [Silurus asotus]